MLNIQAEYQHDHIVYKYRSYLFLFEIVSHNQEHPTRKNMIMVGGNVYMDVGYNKLKKF